MKNKRSSFLSNSSYPSITSSVGLILIVLFGVLSFLGGSYYQTKKYQTEKDNQTVAEQKLIVSRVVDGDTLQLQNGKEIRLYGMSTPEQKENFYQEANQFTENLVLNKEITLEQEKRYKQDKFGRLLGYVFVDGVNLNIELVRNGLAKVVLYEKRAELKYQDVLLSAEKEAKEKRMGIWSSQ